MWEVVAKIVPKLMSSRWEILLKYKATQSFPESRNVASFNQKLFSLRVI